MWLVLLLLVPALALVGLPMALLRARRRLRDVRAQRDASSLDEFQASRCRCGYELAKLDRIRCPECGRVFGFDATPQELGLSDDELRRATEARDRRGQGS